MPQSLAAIYVHVIYSTKNRQPLIRPEIEEELRRYHAGILRNLESPMICSDGTADHIHTLFRLGRKVIIADVVEELKKSSSKWIKTKGPEYSDFIWQSGYGAFSVGQAGVEDVKRYIANQKEYHRQKTFQEEYREFLSKYEIEYDELYVWD
jgi:REP element-mobilizing transposase RayT